MKRKSFGKAACGIARSMDILGDAWTFLIIREALLGVAAFDELVERLKIPRNTLAARLDDLVANGLMSKTPDPADRRRTVYELEPQGCELWIVLLALQQWGNKWLFADEGAPSFMADRETRKPLGALKACSRSGRAIDLEDVTMVPGPSATPALKARFAQLP